jgi:hypothetical protein
MAFADEPDMTLSADGMGNIRIGVPIDVLQREVHQNLPYNPYENHGCAQVTTMDLEPWGVSFMIEQKVLTRINVDYYGTDPRPPTIKTAEGIGLGSSEADVIKAYGSRVRIKPNALDPTWHTLFVDTPDHTRGMIFETDGKTVKSLRVGQYPSIESPSGCGEGP